VAIGIYAGGIPLPIRRIFNRLSDSEPFRTLRTELEQRKQNLKLRGLPGSLTAFAIAQATKSLSHPILVVCSDPDRAENLRDDLEKILDDEHVGLFPSLDISPYDGRSPHLDVVGLRLEALDQLTRDEPGVVVAPLQALLFPTISPEIFDLAIREIKIGQEHSPQELADHLVELGFERVTTVEGVGQFSVRGGILDFCSFGNEHPVRLEFWGDEVTSIRGFDLSSQRSVEELKHVRILPCREGVLVHTLADTYDENIAAFEKANNVELTLLRENLMDFGAFDGIESYLSILYGKTARLLGFVQSESYLFVDDPAGIEQLGEETVEKLQNTFDRKKSRRGEPEHLAPEHICDDPESTMERVSSLSRIENHALGERDGSIDFKGISGRKYEGHLPVLQDDLTRFWRDSYDQVLLCESPGQKARMEELLEDSPAALSIEVGTLQAGFVFPKGRVVVFNDHEIYSRHRRQRRYRRIKEGSPIKNIAALSKGDFVVHVDHGIGKYLGLERLAVDGIARDCLTLSYRENDKVFVPIEQMGRVEKYSSEEGATPVLNKLGTAAWERVKEKTKKEIFKMATELVSLYAERKAKPGVAYSPDGAYHTALAASFPFQETRDQMQAIEDVREDMESESAMDRLICGDVGYGKTEVAIRAAYKAVNDGKQVAVLVPTTILAQQHGRTFAERMGELPVRVDVLSRFRTKAEQTKVIAGVNAGKVDVLIGTHRILSKDIEFKDLGLLIVDEEHRFGVKHKERLKQMRRLVDVMTLTATPIPRTLHMSLMGARDMSIIETPPKDRLPINTEIVAFSEERIAEAILREIDRGGQVYFVHNRVQSIFTIKEFLERLVPQVRFGVGHGQMPERELEKVMLDFMDQKYDCLISTMIIESGLDIPTVNTLIVNRADRMGLAQLYQLRGRVGRSNRRAYAYLFIPSWKALRKPAARRLRAIEEFSDLGSGFHISMRDMEIRGAGNLLGAQQHGHITAIGFDMYCRLLDEAVRQIKGEEIAPGFEPDVQTSVSAYVPDEYIADANLKMSFYQRMGDAKQSVELLAIEEELQDRFGNLPDPTAALLDSIHVKLLARQLGIRMLTIGQEMIVRFLPERTLTRQDVEGMVNASPLPLQFFLGEEGRVEVDLEGNSPENRLKCAKNVLMSLL
jgi:transcription-repair coupling factor (superfamily II helicase)